MKNNKLFKKVAIAIMLGLSTVAPLSILGNRSVSATTYTASKYFPGESADTDAPYDHFEGDYFRNFKHKKANIYVKDKSLKKIFKKAAKAWAPAFKFKFVKSAKHANYNSSKYANVIVLKDGGSNADWVTINKLHLLANSKIRKKMYKDFPSTRKESWYVPYFYGKITNYKKWKANQMKRIAGDPTFRMGPVDSASHGYAPEIGMKIPSDSDAKKNSWHNYIVIAAGTRGLTKTQQLGNATEALGEIIGIDAHNPLHEKYEISNKDFSTSYYKFKVSKSDLDHVDWIYSHPWNGYNSFIYNSSILA